MLGNRKLILDTGCETYRILRGYADDIFWDINRHINEGKLVPGAVYVFGREQIKSNAMQIRELVDTVQVVFSNPVEGSETLKNHCYVYDIADLVLDKKITLVGGGDMAKEWPCLPYDCFLPKILDYNENITAIKEYQDRYKLDRPYKFLFLNGSGRHHREYMITRLDSLLPDAIWSNLDARNGKIKLLESKYEIAGFDIDIDLAGQTFVKNQVFPKNAWGDVYLKAETYLDTYFSLVSETVHRYPYSFRTEKTWKPVAIGHPFIVIANQGFYRDLHNLGFQTFGKLIDESFDQIDNNEERMERVAKVVEDLCQQDLASFLEAANNVCKYNQQHLADMSRQVRTEFPNRFEQFINE
jgi:hypothetical protein